MNGILIAVIIVGFFGLVVGLLVYSVAIDQPRLRRQLKQEADVRGWTYTSGKSLVVTQSRAGSSLVAPQETITESFQGTDQGVVWRMDAIAIAQKYMRTHSSGFRSVDNDQAGERISHHIVWHSDTVRIDHGSVLLYVKPLGWAQSAGAGGIVKAGLESIHASLIYSILRENWGIQNAAVTLDSPELEAKYQIEASDMAAANAALTADVRNFLVNHRPPDSLIHIGDNGLHIVVSNTDYLRNFEKLVALADYGVQLANVAAASQRAAAPVAKPGATDSPTL